MSNSEKNTILKCDVCGGAAPQFETISTIFQCRYCGFKKRNDIDTDSSNNDLISADDINDFFKKKYTHTVKGETFPLILPISRFYLQSKPIHNQVNFFKSKNIMFLLEQHGFHMVSRKSRYSATLNLIVRKV